MTKDIEREAFEKLSEVAEILNEEKSHFNGDFYNLPFNSCAESFINGAWYGFQEAKKLEGCVVVPLESCKWTQDEDSNWWTQCGEGFVFNEDPHPHKHNFKNCCFCGGLLEAARGGK